MSGWRASLVSQWNDNPRLRAGGWIVVVIILVYLLLVLSDGQDSLRSSVADDAERLAKVKSLAGQDVWLERAEAAAALASQLEAELPEARTAGLAQAAMQGQLTELASGFGGNIIVEVAGPTPVPGQDRWVRVPATISLQGVGLNRTKQLLQAIEGHSHLLTIDPITLDNRTPVRLNLTVHGYYRLTDVPESRLAD